MRFTYGYKTSDGERHQGVICAASRDAVFSTLKAKGIKPFGVELAPGLFNRLASFGKRGLVIVILSVAFLVAVGAYVSLANRSDGIPNLDATVRRQPIGDAAIIDHGLRTGWASVFSEKGERFLASFAVPGVEAGVKQATVEEIEAALSRSVAVSATDGIEARQIKAMVEGVKTELRRFVSKGGTIREYGMRLVERQEKEIGYYRQVQLELKRAVDEGMNIGEMEELWKRRNVTLRGMGIRTVPIPSKKVK